MKISEVAEQANLPISTLRYYEKMGIIPVPYIVRDQNNYRKYDPAIIHHLNIVKTCLAVGFSINDIKSMISKDRFTKEEQTRILLHKMKEIEETQQKLAASKQTLYEIIELDIVCEDGFGKYKSPRIDASN